MKNEERRERIQAVLKANQLDLLVCALPVNVLLLSGYWPVVGSGLAVASRDGQISLLVPKDEEDLAQAGWADEIETFKPSPLDKLETVVEAIRSPLKQLITKMSKSPKRVGFESGPSSETASYSAMNIYGFSMKPLLEETLSGGEVVPAHEELSNLHAVKTPYELEQLRTASRIAGIAFNKGIHRIDIGATELEIANRFRGPLSTSLAEFEQVRRAGGFAWCMSGANSALASGAYARSRPKRIQAGDLVLIHMNSYADGYWTDITRTYSMGHPDDRRGRMYEAIFAAREAALQAIRSGVKGSVIDSAARDVLTDRGFGPQFKHSTGHGIGFGAIDPTAKPRLHPKSSDILETGMVFNVEPAIYFEDYGGIRHCDMVAVTDSGSEVLTVFQNRPADILIN